MEWVDEYTESFNKYKFHIDKIKEIVESTGETCEGNCMWEHLSTTDIPELHTKRVNLFHFAKNAKNILEIGFNAGHSCFLFLIANETSKIQLFDIGEHTYSKLCFEYLNAQFPGRLSVTWGDSMDTIPNFYQQNPDTKFDLIHIDGKHEDINVIADTLNCRLLVEKENILLSDDDHIPHIFMLNRRLTELGFLQPVTALQTYKYTHYVAKYVI